MASNIFSDIDAVLKILNFHVISEKAKENLWRVILLNLAIRC